MNTEIEQSKNKYSLKCSYIIIDKNYNKYSDIIFKLFYSKHEFNDIVDDILSNIEEYVSMFIELKDFGKISVIINQISELNEFKIYVSYERITNDEFKMKTIYEYTIKIHDDNYTKYNKENFINILKYNEKNEVKSIKETIENVLENSSLKNEIEMKYFSINYLGISSYEIVFKK